MANVHSVEALFQATFNKPRDPRSDEYKAGVRAALEFRIEGKQISTPHQIGTAQADAFFAGLDEGHRIWRSACSKGGEDA